MNCPDVDSLVENTCDSLKDLPVYEVPEKFVTKLDKFVMDRLDLILLKQPSIMRTKPFKDLNQRMLKNWTVILTMQMKQSTESELKYVSIGSRSK